MSQPTPANGRSSTPPFLKRVKIRNYKSLVNCDVELGALTVLVGRNGAGKSNFLDALDFVAEALRSSLDRAIDSRGGLEALWNSKRFAEKSTETLAIELELNLNAEREAVYGFEIALNWVDRWAVHSERGIPLPAGSPWFQMAREHLVIKDSSGKAINFFDANAGILTVGIKEVMPPLSSNHLYLVNAAGLPEFRDVYNALLGIKTYDLSPKLMRTPQYPAATGLLQTDGANVAGVIGRMGSYEPKIKERVTQYLSSIVPGIMKVDHVALGPVESLMFLQATGAESARTQFYANAMSDGTLRALGILVAVTPLANGGNPVRLVAIEEPETALHPAAAGILMDALHEAAVQTQIVVTTHSPDLLDRIDLETDRILVVESRDGETEIGPIDPASCEAIKEHLFSPGELLRMDQLEIRRADLEPQSQTRVIEAAEDSA